MDEDIKSNDATDTHADVSRRAFIKGVIGSGAARLFRRLSVPHHARSFRGCSHKPA